MRVGFVLAIDQGTTGSTALVLDARGAVRGRGYAELPQHFPRPGWVEHDGDEIWRSVVMAIRRALAKARVPAHRLAAIGITNQRETTLIWERASGRPLARAIVWQDRRTTDACAALAKRGLEREVRRRTGLRLDPYFSATKLTWLLRHHPEIALLARRGRAAFGTMDSWLLWRLTGGAVHATDPTNASRTLLYHIGRRTWDEWLLDLFGVPAALLPSVLPSSGRFGVTHAVPGLPDGIPIAGVAGDQQAALFGQGCVRRGQSKNTYGTGCFLLLNTGDRPRASRAGLLTTLACGPRGEPAYALEGSIFIAGAALQWLRDGLGLLETAAESETLARQVPDAGGVVLVPAFVGLGAPYWRPGVRGALLGLTRGTRRAHVARAALESLAFQTRDVIEAMARDAGQRIRTLRVDGGAAANDFLMQYQADLLGMPVERPRVLETTALGAGLLAGLGVGFWASHQDLAGARRVGRVFRPRHGRSWREGEYRRWNDAVAVLLATGKA
ncbi:MAG: glycerol kinase GlpK [Candidatus Eisenbacteria bacterium]|uniref:Glycerol kinase n=1 Tax=Eiseniibacteriota bacterium TaxID=2212470 RepID=A0A538TU12_UNCEI|nr:MAG: glycerol kinase GlpK [Candidatus Eisenbacteria bacterium]